LAEFLAILKRLPKDLYMRLARVEEVLATLEELMTEKARREHVYVAFPQIDDFLPSPS